jgi:hypothetical protein
LLLFKVAGSARFQRTDSVSVEYKGGLSLAQIRHKKDTAHTAMS